MDFRSGKELLKVCRDGHLKISQAMLQREIEGTGKNKAEILSRLEKSLLIMKNAASSFGTDRTEDETLISGGSRKVIEIEEDKYLLDGTFNQAIAYAMSVLEVNSSMGLIVAAPTAGSSGVIPAALFSMAKQHGWDTKLLCDGLLNASAIGYLYMRNASVAGAEAGCQAEVGAASAMAASAMVELIGGTSEMCLSAASFAAANLLGLVCDPVAGLVEFPCQSRNVTGVVNAFACAQMAIAGVKCLIPFDEMLDVVLAVGNKIPVELRETARGGCAVTRTACALCCS